MTDADVDGSHIRTLLLTFFFRHMQELIKRGNVFIAQPPLYRIKKGKSEKYIKDDKEFTREILRRATENLKLEIGKNGKGPKQTIEAGELRTFLMTLDEFDQISNKVERRLRDARVVEVLGNADLRIDTKADFAERANLDQVADELTTVQVKSELKQDEEHSTWTVTYHDSTNAERQIGVELAARPEYKRLRVLAKQIARLNEPPFTVLKGEGRETQNNWRDLLNYVKTEGTRDVNVQRYKGLGRNERRAALGNHHERRNPHAAQSVARGHRADSERSSPR